MQGLSDEIIKVTNIRVQKEKVNNMTGYVDNVTYENTKKESKEILEIKNTVTELEIALDMFINIFCIAKETVSELEDRVTEILQTEA